MESSVEKISSVQKRLVIKVPKEFVNKTLENVYKKFQKKASIQGFRPGKVPLNLVKKVYKEDLSSDIIDTLINGNLYDAIKEHGIYPIASPRIEKISDPKIDEVFEFSALCDEMPNIELPADYKNLKLTVQERAYSSKDLETELLKLSRKFATLGNLEEETPEVLEKRMITLSQRVSYEGKLLSKMNIKNFKAVMGFNEIYPEIEQALIGMRKGEEKICNIILPHNYGAKELAGKELEFTFNIVDVQEYKMPALDDSFAKDLGYDTIENLKKDLESKIKIDMESYNKEQESNAIVADLLNKISFEVPPALVENVLDGMLKEFQAQNKKVKVDIQDIKMRERFRDSAASKTKTSLLLLEIIKTEKIDISDEQIKEKIRTSLKQSDDAYPAEQEEALVAEYLKTYGPSLKERMLFDQALIKVAESCEIKKNYDAI